MDANIDRVNSMLGAKKLRVASKSLRCVEVLRRIASRSPAFVGVMSYSARESLFLLQQGFTDILCAYPSVDAESIEACERAAGSEATVVWMVDRVEHLAVLSPIARTLGHPLRVCVDLNLSMPVSGLYFGTRRSSLHSLAALDAFLAPATHWEGCELTAVMGYEAQIAGVACGLRRWSPRAAVIRALQRRSAPRVAAFRGSVVDRLRSIHKTISVVNGGGSGSLAWSAAQTELTEVTVGSAYFMPGYFSQMPSMQGFVPAAGFVLPVTRKPSEDVITCQSGGFVASGSLSADKMPRIVHPLGLTPFELEGFGEVQTPMRVPSHLNINVGDNVWLRHAKAGELCEHFNELQVISGSKIVERYATYRGQGKAFH